MSTGYGSLSDVPGVRVGHVGRTGSGWLTGVTVVVPPPGTVGSVDVRGGGPGTHETDALDPTTLVATVDAVCLTGGSAYGLCAAGGAQRWCEEHGRGLPVGPGGLVVPIVPAAAVFDLGRGGDPTARPGPQDGYAAATAAAQPARGRPRRGAVGAGTGALLAGGALRGGIGTASRRSAGGLVVGALAVVNALGSPADPVTGSLFGSAFVPGDLRRPRPPAPAEADRLREHLAAAGTGVPSASNTTLVVVATNARLDPAQARRLATAAHAGLARALSPVHTLVDGDTVFALATGQAPPAGPDADPGRALALLLALHAAAADAVLLAVLDAVLTARPVRTRSVAVPGYAQVCPSAVPVEPA